MPRESLAEALALLERDGVARDDVAAAARRVSVELVLTAHPTEALPRTILEKHRRLAALLDGARRRAPHARRAGSTARSRSPRRSRSCGRPTRFARSGRASSTRSGRRSGSSRTASGTPPLTSSPSGASVCPARRCGSGRGSEAISTETRMQAPRRCARRWSAGRPLVRELLRRDVRALAASWGMSSTLVDADEAVGAVDLARRAQPDRAVPAAADVDLGAARRRRLPVGRRSRMPSSTWSRRASERTAARGSPTEGWPPCGAASTCSGSRGRRSTFVCTHGSCESDPTRRSRCSRRPRRSSGDADRGRSTR